MTKKLPGKKGLQCIFVYLILAKSLNRQVNHADMKTKTKRPKALDAPLDSSPPIIKPRRRRASQGDPIVAKKMVGIRATLRRAIEEYQLHTPVDETAAIHQLVLYGHRYGRNIEEMLAERAQRLGKTRAAVIEDLLMEYYQRTEAERAANSTRAQEKASQIVEAVRADVKTPGHEPPRK